MTVLYELRGKPAEFGDLGLNLYYGCAVGCRCCYDIFLNRRRGSNGRSGGRGPRRTFCLNSSRDTKKIAGDPREILLGPSADPYQSDEAARLTRKASHPEQYHLHVQVLTLCGKRSTQDFDIFRAQSLEIRHGDLLPSETLREENGGPGRAPIAERLQGAAKRPSERISTWVKKISPAVEPAELIQVVESRCGPTWTRGELCAAPRRAAAEIAYRRAPPVRRRRHRPGPFAPYGRERLERQAAADGGDRRYGLPAKRPRRTAANHRRKRDEGGSRTRIGPGDLTLDRQRRFRPRDRRGQAPQE